MKLILVLTTVWVSLILRYPVYAQSVVVKPASTQNYGPKQRGAPTVRRTKEYGGYEVVVPGFEDSPALMDMPDGYLVRDRLEIAPGVEIRVPRVRYWQGWEGWEGEGDPPPPIVAVAFAGGTQQLEFKRFLTDPQLWSHRPLNETTYEIERTGGHTSSSGLRWRTVRPISELTGIRAHPIQWIGPASFFDLTGTARR